MSNTQAEEPWGVFTWPNLLSLLRALGIPVFLILFLGHHNGIWSFLVLAAGSVTDYLDGKIARIFHQESRLGALLDPAIDRIYLLAILIAFAIANILPLWVILLLLSRDLILTLVTVRLKAAKREFIEVSYLGKAATFNLLYALPLMILASNHGPGKIAYYFGVAFLGWGVPLYLLTGANYFVRSLKNLSKVQP